MFSLKYYGYGTECSCSRNSIILGSRCKGEVSAPGVAHPYLINEVISTLPSYAARRHSRRRYRLLVNLYLMFEHERSAWMFKGHFRTQISHQFSRFAARIRTHTHPMLPDNDPVIYCDVSLLNSNEININFNYTFRHKSIPFF